MADKCPWCGCLVECLDWNIELHKAPAFSVGCWNNGCAMTVYTPNFPTEAEAWSAWNTRASPQAGSVPKHGDDAGDGLRYVLIDRDEALRRLSEMHDAACRHSNGCGTGLIYEERYVALRALLTDAPVAGDARWYVLDRNGAATLCVDEADARSVASECDQTFPRMAPHTPTRMVAIDRARSA